MSLLWQCLEHATCACLSLREWLVQATCKQITAEQGMSNGQRILLVEDDTELARQIVRGLERENWALDRVASLADAFEAIILKPYRAILLDRRLPDGDGLSLIPAIKSRPVPAPVIVLTARDEVADRIQGLDAGADDYLVKPFDIGELLARLRANCRRPVEGAQIAPVQIGLLSFDLESREASVKGAALSLPRLELAILELLVRRAGRVVQRTHVESELYGFDSDVSPNALETQVSRLRRRLLEAGTQAELRTIRGVGYLLQPC